MNLQEIKKEIETLKQESSNIQDVLFLGLSKIRIIGILTSSIATIFLVKPIYIYDISKDKDDKIQTKLNYKRVIIVFIISTILFFLAQRYLCLTT